MWRFVSVFRIISDRKAVKLCVRLAPDDVQPHRCALDEATLDRLALEAAAKVDEAARAIEAAFQADGYKDTILPFASPTPAAEVLPPCASATCQAAASVAWAEFKAKRNNRAKNRAVAASLIGAAPVRIAPNGSHSC